MTFLANRLSKEDCLKKLAKEGSTRKTVSFYRYVKIKNPCLMRDQLYRHWFKLGVLGRIYLAHEGINAQISVPEPHWDLFVRQLDERAEFKDMMFKERIEEGISFWKLNIKVKKQIVADGLEDDQYDVTKVGTHLNAQQWNEAMVKPNTVVVDMRNHYESRIGHFENAITPNCDTFAEELPMVCDMLADKKDKKVLLYCTGGIRCEKASAYLKSEGFTDVNQLHGGIIQYAHDVRRKGLLNRFKGTNYVFDGRMDERVTDDVLATCDQCDKACDRYTNCANVMCNLLFIQCNDCQRSLTNCCTKECQQIIQLSDAEQRQLRKKQKSSTFETYRKRVRPELKQKMG